MRILVTGAAGLYGIHTVDMLVKRNDVSKVIGVDNFSREFLVADPFSLVASGRLKRKSEVLRMDFRDLSPTLIDRMDVDVVIHYAACVSIPESARAPLKYFRVNELGTFRFLHTLLKTKKHPFLIYASSPEVYGNPVYAPMDTNHPLNPVSTYAATKLAAEKHCQSLYQWYGYPVAIVRNFNTFGENQNTWKYAAVIPNFVIRALSGQNLPIDGDGKQTRDFLYVKDAVRAYGMLIDKRDECKGETFNIGTGVEISVRELARTIIELVGSKSRMLRVAPRKTDLSRLCADISHTTSKLGWKPEVPFEKGLQRTIEWLRGVQK